MNLDDAVTLLLRLKKEFEEHQHTGIDSKPIEVTLQLQSSLTAVDGATVDATYGAQEQGVINNTRTRVTEIENALRNVGILP
jgi:hypothetical protein